MEKTVKGKGSRNIIERLADQGFTTIHHALYSTPEQLQKIIRPTTAKRVTRSLSDFFEDLKITPSLRLMRGVTGKTYAPLPAYREADLDQVVFNALDSLAKRERRVVEQRYGITNWQPRTLAEVAEYFQVTRERIRQIENKSLRKLRHPGGLRRIEKFLSLTVNSIGYEIAELDIVGSDLDSLKGLPLEELGQDALDILKTNLRVFPYLHNLADLVQANTEYLNNQLSESQLEQLGVSLRDVYEKAKSGEHQKKAEPTDDLTTSEKTEDSKDQVPAYQNRLLPDLDIPREILDLIGNNPLYEVNVPVRVYDAIKRQGIDTIGDVIGKTADELLTRVRNFGSKGLDELTYAVEIYIREVMTKDLEPGAKEKFLLDRIRSLPEISAGKFQPTDRDKFSVKDFGSVFN